MVTMLLVWTLAVSVSIQITTGYKQSSSVSGVLDIACQQMRASKCPIQRNWRNRCPTERLIPGGEKDGGDFRLKYIRKKMSWFRATKMCRTEGWELAMPDTKEKQEQLKQMPLGDPKKKKQSGFLHFAILDMWIGLKDFSENDTFSWLDDRPLSYTDWLPEQPNHLSDGREENCATYHVSTIQKGWNDRPCDRLYPFVCQF